MTESKYSIKSILKQLAIFFAILGPGIITGSVDNDAGGIATYSLAGADFGYSLLWISIPVLILLIIVQEMCARLGVVTGKGLADLIRENFSLKITFIIMSLLVIVNLTNTILAGYGHFSLLTVHFSLIVRHLPNNTRILPYF